MAKMVRATTVAQANAQKLQLPWSLEDNWRQFAGLIDGYAIATELDSDLMQWSVNRVQQAMQKGQFSADVTVLDLRLMLFVVFRSDYMSGYTYTELNGEVDFILHAIGERIGQPYQQMSDSSDSQ